MRSRTTSANRPALFNDGFRPFFLLAAVWAPVPILLWSGFVAGLWQAALPVDALAWHRHETIFGYGSAVVAGFLLTAVPNWADRLPVAGPRLVGLVTLWLAGRVVLLIDSAPFAVLLAVDFAFMPVLTFFMAREIVLDRNWRNLPIIAALAIFSLANLLWHLEAASVLDSHGTGWRLAFAVLLLLIALIGGRIVPSFTRNWLAKRSSSSLPAAFGRPDGAVVVLTALALLIWVFRWDWPFAGAILILAGLGNCWRLSRWRSLHTLTEPLLAILHVGYLWLSFGLVLLGLAVLLPNLEESLGIHALGTGAIGTMTLAVMTRASLGHSNRTLTASVSTTAIYVAVFIAASLRLCAAIWQQQYFFFLGASAAFWCLAFALFALSYGPLLLTSPRR